MVPRRLRLAASRWLAARTSARIQRELAALADRGAPIVAGPWLGEVGFELLYWVPFLAWFAERFRVAPERLLVMSRGGTGSWYRPFAAQYADAFEYVTPEVFRAEHLRRVGALGEQKQTQLTEFERRLLAGVTSERRLTDWSLIHPSSMYELYQPFWWGHLTAAWVHRHATFRPLAAPPADDADALSGLPATYTAVKFYYNECFPATDANRAFVDTLLNRLVSRGPVVALSTGLNIDDHRGCRVDGQGVYHLPEGLHPARNLDIQSRVVARATAFVGTYGGFSYLAPFYGVPAVAVYSAAGGFSPRHLSLARDVFARLGRAGLLQVQDAGRGDAAVAEAVNAHG